MIHRRQFLKTIGITGALMPLSNIQSSLFDEPEFTRLTILHTNDVHSRVEPFPLDGSRNAGQGGAARRASLIQKIRKEEDQVLLLDCGDIFQGTPYFNFFEGEVEIKLMNAMKYDLATIGNHDFDLGVDNLSKHLKNAQFEMLNANYIYDDTSLVDYVKPHKVLQKGDLKIGVFGIGIELDGLVPKELYGKTVYTDPVKAANKTAKFLKDELKCDLVICLSHLGFKYRSENTISDVKLAQSTRNIDVILGGHTHTFMRKAENYKDLDGKATIINQVGWAGIMLGRLDLVFEKNRKGHCISCKNLYL